MPDVTSVTLFDPVTVVTTWVVLSDWLCCVEPETDAVTLAPAWSVPMLPTTPTEAETLCAELSV